MALLSAPHAAFLRRVVSDQAAMGAVAPTSTVLARRMAELVPPTPGLRVLELGAGTGAISAAIGRRLGADAVHLAVDRDAELIAGLAVVAPRAIAVRADAADLLDVLAAHGLEGVDVVLSSLPWSNFPAVVQDRLLSAVRAALADDGVFATIAYRPTRLRASSRRFHGRLHATFAQVVPSATTWANVPPARLLVAHGA